MFRPLDMHRQLVAKTSVVRQLVVLSAVSFVLFGLGNALGQCAGVVTTPLQMPPSGQAAVSAGGDHSLFLDTSGRVWASGNNGSGQLGLGWSGPTPVSTPRAVAYITDVVAIAAGWGYSLALRADGTVFSWGGNAGGRLGLGQSSTTLPMVTIPTRIIGLANIVTIAASTYHAMAIDTNGQAWSWGINSDGVLGIGSTNGQYWTPQAVTQSVPFQALALGDSHSLAISTTGFVFSWGLNHRGQLGQPLSVASLYVPTQLPSLPSAFSVPPGNPGVCAIAATSASSFAIDGNGKAWAWGSTGLANGGCACLLGAGVPTANSQPTPVQVQLTNSNGTFNLTGVNRISGHAFGSHVTVTDGNANLKTWGPSPGTGLSAMTNVALDITTGQGLPYLPLGTMQRISSGGLHTLALDANGDVWGWGNNNFGQLGIGTNVGAGTTSVITRAPIGFNLASTLSMPGSDDDLVLMSGVSNSGGWTSAPSVHTPKQMAAGDTLSLLTFSPRGDYDGAPLILAAQLYVSSSGLPLQPLSSLPILHLFPSNAVVLVNGLLPGFFGPIVYQPSGTSIAAAYPGGLVGNSARFQAIAVTMPPWWTAPAPGTLVMTNAVEVILN